MNFIKLFNNHLAYEEFTSSDKFIKPNVSHCIEENHVHYNPLHAINGHEYIDFKLPSGTLWAKMNVGANSETDSGLYFALGETQGYSAEQVDRQFNENDYQWYDANYVEDDGGMTKYNNHDGLEVLLLEDDAAHAAMGGEWKMPKKENFIELVLSTNNGYINSGGVYTQYDASYSYELYMEPNTSITATTDAFSGTCGFIFFKPENTLESALNSGEYMFIPSGGIFQDATINNTEGVYIYTSQLGYYYGPSCGWNFYADEYGGGLSIYNGRDEGKNVRGVIENKNIEHPYIDLGLPSGTLWATMNVGASNPYEVGSIFTYGSTVPEGNSYLGKYTKYITQENGNYKLTKYCSFSGSGYQGFADYKTELDLEDDPAYVAWGGDWHTPSAAQLQELADNTDVTSGENDGDTIVLTSKINGEKITLPGFEHKANSFSYATSSTVRDTLVNGLQINRHYLSVYFGFAADIFATERGYALPVRPVIGYTQAEVGEDI